jgi:hypothetical protein
VAAGRWPFASIDQNSSSQHATQERITRLEGVPAGEQPCVARERHRRDPHRACWVADAVLDRVRAMLYRFTR